MLKRDTWVFQKEGSTHRMYRKRSTGRVYTIPGLPRTHDHYWELNSRASIASIDCAKDSQRMPIELLSVWQALRLAPSTAPPWNLSG